MTEESKRYNIGLEIGEAESRLADGDALLERRSWKSAVSLFYYAVFHYARALLLMEGLEAKSHGGVVHLVSLHFVRCGRLSPENGDILAQLQARRERAEYDAAAVYSEVMAVDAQSRAREFVACAKQLLQDAKYL